jgi:hypothetical protein
MITIKEQKIYLFKSVKNLELKKYCFNILYMENIHSVTHSPVQSFANELFFKARYVNFSFPYFKFFASSVWLSFYVTSTLAQESPTHSM